MTDKVPTIKAAGVLPYSKDAKGNTYFLLGRERPNENWGIDSSSWSEFGGSMNKNETPEEGAAREFFEETMGVVFGDKQWMENELKQGRYLLVMDSRTPSGKGYRAYVKYIPFVNYPEKFARYTTLSRKQPETFKVVAPFCFQEDGRLLPSCSEKTCMSWFSVDQMRRAVEKYKQAKSDPNLLAQNLNKHRKPHYDESESVPHIRRGFAMDFDHLLNTSWGRDNFNNDESHFSPKTCETKILGAKTSGVDTPHIDMVLTQSGCLKPVLKTPRFYQPLKKPPVVAVNLEGYSFKKKRKRNNNKKDKQEQQNKGWKVVSSKKSALRAKLNDRYKPNPPIF